jgi:hypothetical protein
MKIARFEPGICEIQVRCITTVKNIVYSIAACSLKAITVESQQPAVTRQRRVNNRGMVFSVQSVPRCHKQDKLGAVVSYITAGVQSL